MKQILQDHTFTNFTFFVPKVDGKVIIVKTFHAF